MLALASVVLEIVINTLRPRQNGRNFAEDILKWIFLNENVRISLKIPLKFIHIYIYNVRSLLLSDLTDANRNEPAENVHTD